jgi:hypothetical protein
MVIEIRAPAAHAADLRGDALAAGAAAHRGASACMGSNVRLLSTSKCSTIDTGDRYGIGAGRSAERVRKNMAE